MLAIMGDVRLAPSLSGGRASRVARLVASVLAALAVHVVVIAVVILFDPFRLAGPPPDREAIPVEVVERMPEPAKPEPPPVQPAPQPQPPPSVQPAPQPRQAQAPQQPPASQAQSQPDPPKTEQTPAQPPESQQSALREIQPETEHPQEADKTAADEPEKDKGLAPRPNEGTGAGADKSADKDEAPRLPYFVSQNAFRFTPSGAAAPDRTSDNYRSRVLGKVAAARREPPPVAGRKPARGVTVVGFMLDDAGGLARVWLAQTSGSRDLDNEALDMVRRAAPFGPPPPAAIKEFAAAIAFGVD